MSRVASGVRQPEGPIIPPADTHRTWAAAITTTLRAQLRWSGVVLLNEASGVNSTIAGGQSNLASGTGSTISGGPSNYASGSSSTIGGGAANMATQLFATISGGSGNHAFESYATVGGGTGNQVTNQYGTVGGGGNNQARGLYSVVAGGGGNSQADSNSAIGSYSVIGGGYHNYATADAPASPAVTTTPPAATRLRSAVAIATRLLTIMHRSAAAHTTTPPASMQRCRAVRITLPRETIPSRRGGEHTRMPRAPLSGQTAPMPISTGRIRTSSGRTPLRHELQEEYFSHKFQFDGWREAFWRQFHMELGLR